jgi:Protein of unknown function (DUF3501)
MTTTNRKLTLADIADLRAYEREREEFRAHVIALKKRRRIGIGPVITVVFENRDTMRFQIQEMARAERIITDEGIQTELDVYNPVIPEPGHLSATLFIELTTDEELREWLPKLVGIERSVVVRFAGHEVRCRPDTDHEAQLTRDEITASVHYVQFDFSDADLAAWSGNGPVELAVDHPEYDHSTTLSDENIAELTADLRE